MTELVPTILLAAITLLLYSIHGEAKKFVAEICGVRTAHEILEFLETDIEPRLRKIEDAACGRKGMAK